MALEAGKMSLLDEIPINYSIWKFEKGTVKPIWSDINHKCIIFTTMERKVQMRVQDYQKLSSSNDHNIYTNQSDILYTNQSDILSVSYH